MGGRGANSSTNGYTWGFPNKSLKKNNPFMRMSADARDREFQNAKTALDHARRELEKGMILRDSKVVSKKANTAGKAAVTRQTNIMKKLDFKFAQIEYANQHASKKKLIPF